MGARDARAWLSWRALRDSRGIGAAAACCRARPDVYRAGHIAAASASRSATRITHPPPGSSLRIPNRPGSLVGSLLGIFLIQISISRHTHEPVQESGSRVTHCSPPGLTDHRPHPPAYPVLSLRSRRGAARRYAPPPPILPAATPEKDRPRPVPGNSTPATFAHCGTKLTREAPPPGGFRLERSAAVPLNASFTSGLRPPWAALSLARQDGVLRKAKQGMLQLSGAQDSREFNILLFHLDAPPVTSSPSSRRGAARWLSPACSDHPLRSPG